MPFFTSPVQSPAVPACQNPSVAARAPETHFYRPRGNPFQKLPKSIHSHSHSLSASSIFSSSSCASTHTNSPQDIVARILAQDEVPRGTFMAAEKEKAKSKRGPAPGPVQVHVQQQTTTTSTASTTTTTRTSTEEKKAYPERLDSRRALLSVINGPKAPIVFKGFGTPAVSLPPMPSMPAPQPPVQKEQQEQQPLPQQASQPQPQPTAAVSYLHKQLPPTPPSSHSSQSPNEPSAQPCEAKQQSRALPPVRPLNLDLKQHHPLNANRLGAVTQETLAKRRFSRILTTNACPNARVTSGRFRAVPAPIKPPRILGPSAFNGPSSANTSEEELLQGNHLELDQEDEDDLFGMYARDQDQRVVSARASSGSYDRLQLSKKVSTPMGELPITPLDIPVDWDDLRDRWTSPVMIAHQVETATLDQLLHEALEGIDEVSQEAGDELDLSDAFHDKVVVIKTSDFDSPQEPQSQPEQVIEEEEEEDKEKVAALERQAFAAFQEDVAELFRGSPTRTATDDWKTEAGSSIRRLTTLTTSLTVPMVEKEPEVITASPISSCSASASFTRSASAHSPSPSRAASRSGSVDKVSPSSSTTSLSSSEGGAGEKEKRHGRVLVKKELKLCINIDTSYVNRTAIIDRDEHPTNNTKYGGRLHGRCREDPKAGESFLMMSPESASTRASAIAW